MTLFVEKSQSVPPCKCASQDPHVTCTDMCEYGAQPEHCDNTREIEETSDSKSDSDDEDTDIDDNSFERFFVSEENGVD